MAGWKIPDLLVPGIKLRDLVVAYDSALLHDWDQTSNILGSLHSINVTVVNLVNKRQIRPRPASAFHPYRERQLEGMKVNQSNISVLKLLAGALAKS